MLGVSLSSFIRIETGKIPDYAIEVKGFLGRTWGYLPAPPERDPSPKVENRAAAAVPAGLFPS